MKAAGPVPAETVTVTVYTARQISFAAGIPKPTVLKALKHVVPSGVIIVRGNEAPTWAPADFPKSIRARFTERAAKFGIAESDFMAVQLQLAVNGVAAWKPSVPLAEIAEHCLADASKLREALLPALQRLDAPTLSPADRARLGLADYKRTIGHEVSERHWRRLMDRTLSRDGGAEDFTRLELYLPECPPRKAVATTLPPHENEFRQLDTTIRAFKNPSKPSATEKALVWAEVCELFGDKQTKAQSKKLRQRLVNFLARLAPALGKNTHALRVNLSRKLEAWKQSGGNFNELVDGRTESERRTYELAENEKKMLTASAALFGGGLQMAWRECFKQLSEKTRAHYPNARNCPRKIRLSLRNLVTLEKAALRGPKHVRVSGAFVNRDPDGIASGDWDQCDDMTPVNYWWEESETDPRGVWFGQGQWLPWIDERSWFIYEHTLVSDPYYDGFNIRNSWTKKAADWGLPRCGLSLERGIWKRARILVGRKDDLDPNETETGLRRYGLRFHHFQEARGKVIERVFAELQNYFQAAPGYVGRIQMVDRYENVQKKIALVKSGKAHPADLGFLHKSELDQVFTTVCRAFNDRPMHGKYHLGRSPRQVFEECFTTKLLEVPKEFRWLLASNRIVSTVTANGIKFDFGRKQFRYKSYEIGCRIGSQLAVFFNPERPETVCCTDLDGTNPIVVEREVSVAPHDAAPGTLEKALAQNAEQNRFRRELHCSLKPYYNTPFFRNMFRPVFVDSTALENSHRFSAEHNRIEAEQKAAGAQLSKARAAYGELGATPPRHLRPESLDAAQKLKKLRQEYQAETATEEKR